MARKICNVNSCDRRSDYLGKCFSHIRTVKATSIDDRCSADGCQYVRVGKGYCLSHLQQVAYSEKMGTPLILRPVCLVTNCDQLSYYGSGVCKTHKKDCRYSDLLYLPKIKVRGTCREDGCQRKPKKTGLCRLHESQLPLNRIRQQERNARPENVERRSQAYKVWRESKRGDRDFCAKRMWSRCKKRALEQGIEFTIKVSDIHIPDTCPLLELTLDLFASKANNSSPSLDRINSKNGYVPGNVWVISNRANRIKNDATLPELEALTRNLKKALGDQV